MADEARVFQREEESFVGKVADVFTITGQGTFVMLEETVGRPRVGQRLEVVHSGNVVGTLVVSGFEKALRPQDGDQLVLTFKSTQGVRLERGQLLRIPPVVVRPASAAAADPFTSRLGTFVSAIGWTTVTGLVATFLVWIVYGLYTAGVFTWTPVWFEPVWLWFALAVTILEVVLAAIWLTANLWFRRLAQG